MINFLNLFENSFLSMADTPLNTAEEKRHHRFLIYLGLLMSLGGILWGSISFYSGLMFQSTIPFSYTIITIFNFTYLYLSKNFKVARFIQILISLLLPFLF